MPSSNRVIKANHASSGTNKAMIATEYEVPKKKIEVEEDNKPKQKLVPIEKSEALLKEAKNKKQELLAEAKAEIEEMKESAYQTSYNKGHEEGLKKGYEEGYHQGFDKGYKDAVDEVELESIAVREESAAMLAEAHKKMQEYEAERKDDFLKLASHMAEKIVHDYIDQSDKGLLAIAKPYFYQIDKEEEFVTITVHPDQREAIEENLDEIKSISPGTRFMILGSPSIEERGMLIESSHSIVDLQIKNQLDRMLEEFHEMERTLDA